jgi:hypothetical protein
MFRGLMVLEACQPRVLSGTEKMTAPPPTPLTIG